jgi:hypothetical protein
MLLLELVRSINQDFHTFRITIAEPLRDFDGRVDTQSISLDNQEGETGLLKCVICLLFHYLNCMTNFPLWMLLAQGHVPAELQENVARAAKLCPESAMTCVSSYRPLCHQNHPTNFSTIFRPAHLL